MCREGNQAFREAMALLEKHPCVRGLSFTSFLILPFQRITRLKLLVQVSKHGNTAKNNGCNVWLHCDSVCVCIEYPQKSRRKLREGSKCYKGTSTPGTGMLMN